MIKELPPIELTVPRTGPVGPGEPEAGADAVDGWALTKHPLFFAGTICTTAAVNEPFGPGAPPCSGRTLTQLPTVTSVTAAGSVSQTLVLAEKPTVTVPSRFCTDAVVPLTDSIRPAAWSLPLSAVGAEFDDALLVADAWGAGGAADDPHAATEIATRPVRSTPEEGRCSGDAEGVRCMGLPSRWELGWRLGPLMRSLCVGNGPRSWPVVAGNWLGGRVRQGGNVGS